jgi:inosine-uridine nucleoside N-ribohydrolase
MVVKVHLDTDLGGDPDDACALAMLLGWPGVELTGITTVLDEGGQRAGYVHHVLELAGRTDIPVVAGEAWTLTNNQAHPDGLRPDVAPRPSPRTAFLDCLDASVAQGATIIAIGPLTNIAIYELSRQNLANADVVAMGGWLQPPAAGLPPWGPEMDWNIQFDTRAAQIVGIGSRGRLTLVTLPATLTAWLRGVDLPRLRAAGPLGELLAAQSQAHGRVAGMTELGRAHPGLPDDLLNFHYDPVTAAVAVGWTGVRRKRRRLEGRVEDGVLRFERARYRPPMQVVTAVDGDAFRAAWLAAVERAAGRRRR